MRKLSAFALPVVALLASCSESDRAPAPPVEPVTIATSKAASSDDRWPGFGGPDGNFRVEAPPLATSWPAEGPPVLWQRALGAGYSAIAAEGGVLYTMYRDGDRDAVIAIDAADGATLWEQRYEARAREKNVTQFGEGPHASPLIVGDHIVTLGYTGLLHCWSAADGSLLWKRDLVREYDAQVLEFGSSASPILFEGSVIVLVGGEQAGAIAFSPEDGAELWRSAPTSVSYATPIVIDLDGQSQLLYFSSDAIHGLDASTGASLWSAPVVNQYLNNCTPPQWDDDGLLWVATQLDGGARALRLSRDADGTKVEELWSNSKLSIHFWNSLRLGSYVYASIGSNALVLVAVDMRNGEILWQERGFEQVNFVHTGDLTLMLDANGQLALARLAPEGLTILAQTEILEGPMWSAPTLVGSRLYVRNKKSIVALELGRQPAVE